MAKHVAIVMDGNGRWAEQQALPRIEGHRAGVETVRAIVQACVERDIDILSLFTFSSENWSRPTSEVDFLMQLFIHALEKELDELNENGVRLRFTGERAALSPALQDKMKAAELLTQGNQRLTLNLMMNYGGKWDILQAAKTMSSDVISGQLALDHIDESTFASYLSVADLPDPDLLIRTSGEQRISNFFLWQFAYTELYFSDIFWPDFTVEEFDKALTWFSARERRYGKTSKQVVCEDAS